MMKTAYHRNGQSTAPVPVSLKQNNRHAHKPFGLWFTPTPDGWKDAVDRMGLDGDYGHTHTFEIDMSRMLVIDSVQMIDWVCSLYGDDRGWIDWAAVQADCAGVWVSGIAAHLFNDFDIESGCVWDASAIK